MSDIGNFPFIEAKWKNILPSRGIDLWVIHSAETSEGLFTAESLGSYFTDPVDSDWNRVKASSHLNFDADSVVRSVHDKDIAFAAPGINHNGIQVEHAGRASQTKGQWLDGYGINMLSLSARVCGMYCLEYNWPVTFRNSADLLAGGMRGRGITTHWEGTKAFRKSNHTDPGRNFPIDWYVNQVLFHISNMVPPEVIRVRIPNIVGASQSPGGAIYLCNTTGGVFATRGGAFVGNMEGKPMNAPVCDIVAWSNQGYWLVGEDGGIFTFGDAPQVPPYDPPGPTGLADEWRRGERAVKRALLSLDRKLLILLTDDLRDYNLALMI